MLVVGGIVLAYPFWSGAYAWVQQGRIDREYAAEVRAFRASQARSPSPVAPDQTPKQRLQRLADSFAGRLDTGDPLGRLEIPRIELDTKVLEGVREPPSLGRGNDQALLRNAPVHYGLTPLPGQGQPFAVAGHRTTYGAPFLHLDDLRRGDPIVVTTPYARLEYVVAKKTVVKPGNITVLYDRGYDLVLTTCHPPYSARSRLIVWGRLKAFTPR